MARKDRERFFARGKRTWYLEKHEHAVLTTYEAPREKFHLHHTFCAKQPKVRRATCDAFAEALQASWRRDGFEPVDRATFEHLVTEEAFIGWIAPFPKDAQYFREGKLDIHCAQLEGPTLTMSTGTAPDRFGEVQNVYHYESPALAALRRDAEVGFRSYKPIDRAEVLKLFKRRS